MDLLGLRRHARGRACGIGGVRTLFRVERHVADRKVLRGCTRKRSRPRAKPAAPLDIRARVHSRHADWNLRTSPRLCSLSRLAPQNGSTARPDLWEPPSYGWVGYFEGKAVSIVTIVIASDAIGVYSLGTLPQHQGCGFGETLLRHAIGDAQPRDGTQAHRVAGDTCRVSTLSSNRISRCHQTSAFTCGKVAPLFDDLPHSKDHAHSGCSALSRCGLFARRQPIPRPLSDQKFTWQYGIEWRLVRAGLRV